MLPALGHCEDLECQSSIRESVRLFRCSIHCDRNLCLSHLNAHNVHYEEEKKQNNIVIHELQNNLNLYQTLFEKQIMIHREVVRQASSIVLHNTTSLVPVDQIRPVLEKIQQAIAVFQEEKVIIKCESVLNSSETENKTVNTPNNNVCVESGQKVVVRIPRVEYNKSNIQFENETSFENDENAVKTLDDGHEQRKSSTNATRRTSERTKKKSIRLKRLQK